MTSDNPKMHAFNVDPISHNSLLPPQVTDVMLQERLYPNWSVGLRKWWRAGYRRIILFWGVVIGCTSLVVSVISTDVIRWDSFNRGFLPSDELSRAFLASFILVMDLLIVIQVRAQLCVPSSRNSCFFAFFPSLLLSFTLSADLLWCFRLVANLRPSDRWAVLLTATPREASSYQCVTNQFKW